MLVSGVDFIILEVGVCEGVILLKNDGVGFIWEMMVSFFFYFYLKYGCFFFIMFC